MSHAELSPPVHRPFEAGELRRHLDMYVLCETSLVLGQDALRQALQDFAETGALGQAIDMLLHPERKDGAALAHALRGEAACMGLLSVMRSAAVMQQRLTDEQHPASEQTRHELHESLWSAWCITHELLHALGFMPEPDIFQKQRGFAQQLPLFPVRLLSSVAPHLAATPGAKDAPPNDGTLVQVAYLSERLPDYPLNLMDLLDTSVRVNPSRGLTGMLLVSATHFFQVLEGPQDAVLLTLEKIRQDPRHTAFQLVSRAAVSSRSIPEWSMAICEVRMQSGRYALSNALLNGHGMELAELVQPGHAFDLLQGFCEGITLLN
jgi:hypothetical protein